MFKHIFNWSKQLKNSHFLTFLVRKCEVHMETMKTELIQKRPPNKTTGLYNKLNTGATSKPTLVPKLKIFIFPRNLA